MGQHHVILVIMVITTTVLVIVVIIILSSLLLLEASSYLSRQFIGKSGQTILLRSFSLLSADELWAAVRLMTVFFVCLKPRRLCDKLVLDERLPLALEVCTKCGVDATGVWLAWGRACLTSGDYTGARDKFSHCLKVMYARSWLQ